MTYSRLTPSPRLRPFVEELWFQEDPRDASRLEFRPTRVLPTGRVDLIVNLGDAFERRTGGATSIDPIAFVGGQLSSAIEASALGRTCLWIVRFRPFGARAFFDVPLAELTDRAVELDLLVGADATRALLGRMSTLDDHEAIRGELESFLEARLSQRRLDPRVGMVVESIERNGGTHPVERVAYDTGVGRRHLARMFREHVGLPPKTFSEIVRFQQALAQRGRGQSWAHAALLSGYCDQAHLLRDARHLAGLSAERLLSIQPQSELGAVFNRPADMSHSSKTIYL